MALSKYKTKQHLKEMLKRLSTSCKEDNLEKFEYSLSEVFKISLGLDYSFVLNLQLNSISYGKVIEFVYQQIIDYNPNQIKEKYFEEISKALEEIKQ